MAKRRFRDQYQFNVVTSLIVLAIMAMIGLFLIVSHAATPIAAVNVASGTVTANAKIIPDTTAVAGQAVQFTAPAGGGDKTVAAVGDIACDPKSPNFNGGAGTAAGCHMLATSQLVGAINPDKVLVLGDNQYESATLANFLASYDKSWGKYKAITSPAIGNHEGNTAAGYFDYFNGAGKQNGPAGDRNLGYYSFDLGSWHIIILNANCGSFTFLGSSAGCAASSPQTSWLQADLQSNHALCTLAVFHTPRFSSGHDGNNSTQINAVKPFWDLLYQYNADLVLNGHSHDYERFAAQDPNGNADINRGLTEIVAGTGGRDFTGWWSNPRLKNSQSSQNTIFGLVKLVLHGTSFDYQFVPEAGKTFNDSGHQTCH